METLADHDMRTKIEAWEEIAELKYRLKKAESLITSDHGLQWCERCNDYQFIDTMSGECEKCVEAEEARCTND